MSWGDGNSWYQCSSSEYNFAASDLRAAGVLPVSSSGNNGAGLGEPACAPYVTSVGAVYADIPTDAAHLDFSCQDHETPFVGEKTCYSSYGDDLDLFAPGSGIDKTGRYRNGTSMAAPLVVGAAAVLKAAQPTLSPDQVEEILKETGVDTAVEDGKYVPRLDMEAALAHVISNPVDGGTTDPDDGSANQIVTDPERNAILLIIDSLLGN